MALVHRVGWDARFVERSPWFWPLAPAAAGLRELADWPTRGDLERVYRQLNGGRDVAPLRFVQNVRKQDKRAGGQVQLQQLYDGRIASAHEVPTRERDWHDLFNALCFATFPRAKHALHQRQYRVLQGRVPAGSARLPPARSPEQDALTLFDEGGALVAAEREASVQLQEAGEVEQSELLRRLTAAGSARVVPFGHALFEHLVEGLRCPGGFTRVVEIERIALPDVELLAELDRRLAALLDDPGQFRGPREGGLLRLPALAWSEARP